MNALAQRLRDEPAMIVAAILAIATLVGVRLSEDQASALSQILTVAGPLLAGLVIRSQVVPVASVDADQPKFPDLPSNLGGGPN